jgi:hypothetical protein
MTHFDWANLHVQLDHDGVAVLPSLLNPESCAALRSLYDDGEHFRSRVLMQRHNYGRGEYQYFRYPLPPLVQQLRETIYPQLVPIANAWTEGLRVEHRFPAAHRDYLERCHAAGQTRPTPLLLKYGTGDYNCLHQDLYGEHLFPLQLVVLLSKASEDFEGGELVFVEQRPRMQSRPQVIQLGLGDAAIFAVNQRPVSGARGTYRVSLRHGVSCVHAGARYALGIIFHDAA